MVGCGAESAAGCGLSKVAAAEQVNEMEPGDASFLELGNQLFSEASEAVGNGRSSAGDGVNVPPAAESSAAGDFPELDQGISLDAQSMEFVFVTLLTVADVERYPVPVIVPDEEAKPIDLAMVQKASAREVRDLVTPTLPDVQLQALLEIEQNRTKPRKWAMDALQAEVVRRGDASCGKCGQPLESVAAHLQRLAADPYCSRIVAAAVAVGIDEPTAKTLVDVADEGAADAEAKLIDWVLSEVGSRDVAAWDAVRQWQSLSVRALRCKATRHTGRPMLLGQFAPEGRSVAEVAGAYGLNVPAQIGAAELFEAVRDYQYRKQREAAVAKLEAERLILAAERQVL